MFRAALPNDKLVLIEGWTESDLQRITDDFKKIYEKDGYPAYEILRTDRGNGLWQLQFPSDIHPILFLFLINYFRYPSGFDGRDRKIEVLGRATFSDEFEMPADAKGRAALFYVPENDQDYDVVFARSESGQAFSISFTNMKWKPVTEPRMSSTLQALMATFIKTRE